MRGRRLPDAASRVLAFLTAVVLAVGLILASAERTVFNADGFAARADAALQIRSVRSLAARRLVDAALRAKPDLVAARPVLEAAADAVIRTSAFRSLLRAAVRDLHRSAFDRQAGTVTLTVADTGILIAEAARALDPTVARHLPAAFDARLTRVGGGPDGSALKLLEGAQRVRRLGLVALGAAALLGLAVLVLSRSRRSGALRLGVSIAATAGCVAVAASVAPRLGTSGLPPADRAAARAVLGVWLVPLRDMALAICGAGAVVAVAAASVVRPDAVTSAILRVWHTACAPPSRPRWRAGRALAIGLSGIAMLAWPATVLRLTVVIAGAVLVLLAIAEVLRLTAAPARREHVSRTRPRGRVLMAATAMVVVAGAAGALAASEAPQAPSVGRCNGLRALCDRSLDRVAFPGTHNSMAAEGEPGWLFAAQDAGIQRQLDDGIRALLIDTHYAVATPRGVATQLAPGSKSRRKIADAVGETFVRTAERLRSRIGYTGGGDPELYLCHAFCEVGATKAADAFAGIHRFLVTHPEEVLILSIEDDTSAAATAAAIRHSGLSREVYRGAARPPWPTLRELVERDERVLVFVENHPGDIGWMHAQTAAVQETPYRFRSPAELSSRTSCRPNRGGTDGSLLLVNHWVDTSPAPRPSIGETVNARPFLDQRLAACRSERGMLPNVVAVDFYRRGELFGAVNALNRAP